jgi:predicted RNA binding protein YcfA (HicA-like mRNA interferase family)
VPRLKCTFREVVSIIEENGFSQVPGRQSGSHRQYKKDARLVTIAYHNIGDVVLPDTLASIIRQSGLSKRLFRK